MEAADKAEELDLAHPPPNHNANGLFRKGNRSVERGNELDRAHRDPRPCSFRSVKTISR